MRAAAVIIVLAVGAHAPLGVVCQALCNPSAAAAGGCHPTSTGDPLASHLTAAHDCDEGVTEQAALRPDDGRRDLAALALTPAPVLLSASLQTHLVTPAGRDCQQVGLNRPRSTPLRI
jgi:hypothetical protein